MGHHRCASTLVSSKNKKKPWSCQIMCMIFSDLELTNGIVKDFNRCIHRLYTAKLDPLPQWSVTRNDTLKVHWFDLAHVETLTMNSLFLLDFVVPIILLCQFRAELWSPEILVKLGWLERWFSCDLLLDVFHKGMTYEDRHAAFLFLSATLMNPAPCG